MSRKNRKNHTATTAGTDDNRHLHAVPEDPGQQGAQTTEGKVRAALAATPGSTTATLAMAAGVGRSTAAKILARWGRDGTATRAAGDGPRNPDTWTLATDRDAAVPDNAATHIEGVRADATPSADDPTEHTSGTTDDTTKAPAVAEDAATDVDDMTTEDTTALQKITAGSDTDADTDGATKDTTDAAAPSSDADVETDNTAPMPDTAPVDPMDSATVNETEPSPAKPPTDADTTRADKDRLAKGGLRALVEQYLTDHPGESFGPAKIGKDLSRSGGAVNNALEKLADDGYAIKTCEAPKRFAINPDKTDLPDTAKDADAPALEA